VTGSGGAEPPPPPLAAEKHKGFAFLQYDERSDAADAIDNMNGAELFGRILKVNIAKADAASRGSHRPIWETQADKFFNETAAGDGNGEVEQPS